MPRIWAPGGLPDQAHGSIVRFQYSSHRDEGGNVGFNTAPSIWVYKDDGLAETDMTAGQSVDHDGQVGIHHVAIDQSSDSVFFSIETTFQVVMRDANILGNAISQPLALWKTTVRASAERTMKYGAVNDVSPTAGSFVTTLTGLNPDEWAGRLLGFPFGASVGVVEQTQPILNTTAAGLVTMRTPFAFAPVDGDPIVLI